MTTAPPLYVPVRPSPATLTSRIRAAYTLAPAPRRIVALALYHELRISRLSVGHEAAWLWGEVGALLMDVSCRLRDARAEHFRSLAQDARRAEDEARSSAGITLGWRRRVIDTSCVEVRS